MDPELLARARQMVAKMRNDGVPDDAIDGYLKQELGGKGLSDVEHVGLRDYARAAGMGATLGFEDELAGLGAAIAPGGDNYTQARDKVRANFEASKKVAPKRMLAAEIGGGLVSGLAGGAELGGALKGAGLGARVLSGAATGALAGGASGVGYSDTDPVRAGLTGAAGGALLGGAIPLAGGLLSKLGRAAVNRFNPVENVARATGHLLPDNAASTMAAREALTPGTTVPAALNPELMGASVRNIGADAAIGRQAMHESQDRILAQRQSLRDIGDQMEQLLAGRMADVDQPMNAPIRKIMVKNGLMPTPHSSGSDVVDLKVIQGLRNKLLNGIGSKKGMEKAAVGEDINTLSQWLEHQAPDIGKLNDDYRTVFRARQAEEALLKHIKQSRRSFSSSRAAGIEPGSPGASLPANAKGMLTKILQPDRKELSKAAYKLLLQPGGIPPELLRAAAPGMAPVPSMFGSLGAGEAAGGLSGSLFDYQNQN